MIRFIVGAILVIAFIWGIFGENIANFIKNMWDGME